MGLVLSCGGRAGSDREPSGSAPAAGASAASNGARSSTGTQPTGSQPPAPLVSVPPTESADELAATSRQSTIPASTSEPPNRCTPPPPGSDLLIKGIGENVVLAYCGSCHGAQLDDGAGGINYINDFDRLIAQGLLVPCDPERSPMVEMMRSGTMPPPSSGVPSVCPFDVDSLVGELAFFCTPADSDAGRSDIADASSASSESRSRLPQ